MPNGEHITVDIRFDVSRGGRTLSYNDIYYNVHTDTAHTALPADRNQIGNINPLFTSVESFYLFLPPLNQQPGNGNSIGKLNVPNFAPLQTAVQQVLSNEGALTLINNQTFQGSFPKHIGKTAMPAQTLFLTDCKPLK